MSQPVLLKVYGGLSPCSTGDLTRLEPICGQALPLEEPPLTLRGTLLLLSFEGIFFPLDELLQELANLLRPQMRGKIDYLDLENWRLSRYLVHDGVLSSNSVPLNNVLDYSGF